MRQVSGELRCGAQHYRPHADYITSCEEIARTKSDSDQIPIVILADTEY